MSAITPKQHRDLEVPLAKGGVRAFHLRAHVVNVVGKEYLFGFEQWAFKSENGMIYDRRVVFLWNCAHSSCQKQGHQIAVIDEILAIWKKHHEMDEVEWSDIYFGD